jgi:hypothetical protein
VDCGSMAGSINVRVFFQVPGALALFLRGSQTGDAVYIGGTTELVVPIRDLVVELKRTAQSTRLRNYCKLGRREEGK